MPETTPAPVPARSEDVDLGALNERQLQTFRVRMEHCRSFATFRHRECPAAFRAGASTREFRAMTPDERLVRVMIAVRDEVLAVAPVRRPEPAPLPVRAIPAPTPLASPVETSPEPERGRSPIALNRYFVPCSGAGCAETVPVRGPRAVVAYCETDRRAFAERAAKRQAARAWAA